MEKSKELETAISAAEEAGKILLERAGSPKVVEIEGKKLKGKADFATDSDVVSEKAIIAAIEKQFPDHNILGEETGKKEKGSKSTWIIDPLDGTNNYYRKFPFFTVSIALAREKEIVLGVVLDPSTKRLYHAEKGRGAFLNGERITVSKTKDLDKAIVHFDFGHLEKDDLEDMNKLVKRAYRVRNIGVGSLGLCYFSQGGYDAYINSVRTSIMDVAAGTVIAQEAGAQITDKKGEKVDWFKAGGVIASNRFLHKDLLELFK